MKRDDELIRSLLFEFEAAEDWLLVEPSFLGASRADRTRIGHINLLCDAGFMTQVGNGTFRLTNSGYDYLEAVRSDTVWNKTKEGASKLGGATLGMMFDLAKAYIKQEAAEKLGINL
ncbi:DUF2513 domain-containing protein [Maritimibacter alkaliphilus]|uniref:DUF2513 domain-containing protein n=1 Tax=Maritimibacter alkaliphilus HTCC2654 TaxID=314271 RepID=A3VBI5_9RHOB|nr:DUF2513 domain-containing protein [Maritimibacter alkaliphilus]EAQ14318.1 hypothetical protein RB2654_16651 [Rhodobacterales bacterium HTCC2654] [Maritimibacter alkaliphilus HTCC2654]